MRQRSLAAEEHAGQVDLLHPSPGAGLDVEHRPVVGWADAGGVHGDVHAPEPLDGERVQPLVRVGVADVGGHGDALDLAGERLGAGDIRDDHPRAFGGEAAADGCADPAGTAGDDGDAPLQTDHSRVTAA